jgi:uncharacterized SAM-binding protein YcdF (DUF218 family)
MHRETNIPIYLAGGIISETHTKSLAEHNKSFFKTLGVERNLIHTISEGRNTEAEAAALAPLLKGKYISLVTSASHMSRAVYYFENLGIKVLPIPVDYMSNKKIEPMLGLPNAHSLYRSERAIHEYLGLIYQQYIR